MNIIDLKVYTPARDFEMSKRFYAAIGFELTEAWAGDVDCRLGGAVFRLQNYYNKTWAENFMMLFGVDNVEEWHQHVKKVIDTGEYDNARIAEPEKVGGSSICHVWDPSGVLLIFIS
ncbi:MAG: hypothetical protein KBD94_09280 [Pyrinomonadaceae bacterium]|nr:hypothetical protein [Pyrinomonadaceae bacterium]